MSVIDRKWLRALCKKEDWDYKTLTNMKEFQMTEAEIKKNVDAIVKSVCERYSKESKEQQPKGEGE